MAISGWSFQFEGKETANARFQLSVKRFGWAFPAKMIHGPDKVAKQGLCERAGRCRVGDQYQDSGEASPASNEEAQHPRSGRLTRYVVPEGNVTQADSPPET